MDENFTDPVPDDGVVADGEEPQEDEMEKVEDILLTDRGRKFLNQTKPWVRFLSIMVFIAGGFMLIGGLVILLVSMAGGLAGAGGDTFGINSGEGIIIGIAYLVPAILYIAPGIFLFRYASAIKILESTRTSEALENALRYQRSFWFYVGVLTVIGLIVLAAAIAFLFAVGFFMALNG